MRITVGHTPDADDAFMFYGMLEGRIPTRGFEVEHDVADIEELNRAAVGGTAPDVTAVSVHACSRMEGYTILRSGGSFGLGYGPILAAARDMGVDEAVRGTVAVPGELTSAFLLLSLMVGRFKYVEMKFSDIPAAVRDGRVAAGLVIHEAQLSYGDAGLAKVADVGRWWDDRTGGLPVPLGVNAMRSSLGADAVREFDAHLRDSIRYGLGHRREAVEYAICWEDSLSLSARMFSELCVLYIPPALNGASGFFGCLDTLTPCVANAFIGCLQLVTPACAFFLFVMAG